MSQAGNVGFGEVTLQEDKAAGVEGGEVGDAELVGGLDELGLVNGRFLADLNAVGGGYGRICFFLLHISPQFSKIKTPHLLIGGEFSKLSVYDCCNCLGNYPLAEWPLMNPANRP